VNAGGAAAVEAVHGSVDIDPMSALDTALGVKKPAFVAAKVTPGLAGQGVGTAEVGNADEIALDDDDDDE
jgi:pre-mRNA-splicing factor SYF1